jgi:hypothetical protein
MSSSLLATALMLVAAEPSTVDATTEDHFAASMGFLVGARRFPGAPFGTTPVQGLRYDFRLVLSHVRMTAGFDAPFLASSDHGAANAEDAREVSSPRLWELRFGLGAEIQVGPIAPYLDLLGTVHFARATSAIDGAVGEWNSTTFGYALRAGARWDLRRSFFLGGGGEIGLRGPALWGAEVVAGFRLL